MITQQFNTIGTLLLTKYIDTGDKILDATLVSTLVIIISSFMYMCYNSRYTIYNLAIFYLYKMWRNPFDLSKNPPYIFNNKKYNTSDDFRRSIVYNDKISLNNFIKYLTKHCININMLLVNTENIPISYINNYNEYSAIMPIYITYNGDIIYLAAQSHAKMLSNTEDIKGLLLFESRESAKLLETLVSHIDNSIPKNDLNYNMIYSPDSSSGLFKGQLYPVGRISKNKTFDTLFFNQKDELIQLLNKFTKRTLYPSHVPIDNKLGILLYGPPGTGKTGTITAIANMVNRHIVTINFTEIRTCSQLNSILKPSEYSKYVYVFDEFDCILDAMTTNNSATPAKTDWGTLLMASEGEERKNILEMIKESSKQATDGPINLAYLLQKLDGLESAEDRLIIATTNHPDKINKALLRPGRFDLKLCLGLCTSKMLIDIITHYYKSNTLATINKIKQCSIPENRISPLELINMAIQTPNLDTLLKQLKSIK